jgi:hypothetical protein
MFAKRNRPVQPPEGESHGSTHGSSTQGGPSLVEPEMPWADDPSEIACNLATGNLANNLMAWVEQDGGVHAETYVATAGAIAGYAAQRSLTKDGAAYPPGMQMATMPSGEQFLFGDPLNAMLMAKTDAILNEVHRRTGARPFASIENVISEAELRGLLKSYQQVTGLRPKPSTRRAID